MKRDGATGVGRDASKGCGWERGKRIWREMGTKDVEGDRGKGCRVKWGQRMWREMGAKGVERTKQNR